MDELTELLGAALAERGADAGVGCWRCPRQFEDSAMHSHSAAVRRVLTALSARRARADRAPSS